MGQPRSERGLGIALVAAAAIAWSTAPFFTRLLPFDAWTILGSAFAKCLPCMRSLAARWWSGR
ncbi:hypothetical protein [Bradyrhizobium sp. LB11.1]|jgi:hypothetical protein|uniref:hypothetical protein n=1 Tax=Bradyrhizobium sp. LB11.1 TaxID=3156326 RepID=UPI00339909DA